jgi:nitroimidazol reductase NimA-like FMN-containing flavoprotein (pyridoxamine 5'-phosphate oxidase superfamily)
VRDPESAGPASPRVQVRRHPERGRYDRETIDAILDEALICHLGVVIDGDPLVLPTGFGRIGDTLYLHGAATNRSLAAALDGVCITVTHVDGLVLARSAFGHSMNFRSVVVRGRARAVADLEERRAALVAVVEHGIPGRWAEVRHGPGRVLGQGPNRPTPRPGLRPQPPRLGGRGPPPAGCRGPAPGPPSERGHRRAPECRRGPAEVPRLHSRRRVTG